MRNIPDRSRGTWATFVRDIREAARLTKAELARRLGVDRGTVHRWEAGQNKPEDPAVVYALAELFAIDVDDALAAAGLRRPDKPAEPPMDPDVLILVRKLADPHVNWQTKAFIRQTLRFLADLPSGNESPGHQAM